MNGFWEFFWFAVSCFLFLAYLMVLFHILTDLMRDRDTSGLVKAAWVVGLVFVPVLTSLAYLIARGPGMAERSMAATEAAQANVEAYVKSVAGSASSPADEIGRAKSLLDTGTISAAEFEALKAKALR